MLWVAASPVGAEVRLSERLTRIAGHLGDGGAHFSVTDSKDDLKDLSGLIDQVIGALPDGQLPAGLKVEALFEDLGLFALEGSGASSHQVGDLWHSRSFFLTNGKHEGVLSLLGKESRISAARGFAPAGADLVLETSLDLREVERTMVKIAKAFGPDAEEEVASEMKSAITSAGLSLADLFVDFTVRGTLVLWMDDEKTFEMGPELMLPVLHFAGRLENAGLLWKILKKEMEGNDESVLEEKDGEWTLRPKEKDVEAPWGMVQPQLVFNPESGELFVAMSDADLAACRGKGPKISEDADFEIAATGFPGKLSGLAYVSKDVLNLITKLTKEFSGEIPEEARGMVMEVIPHLEKLAARGGFAGGFAVEKDGFLFVANLPFPIKGGGLLGGAGGIATIATFAGIAAPVMVKAKQAAEQVSDFARMKQLAVAQMVYQIDEGKFAGSLRELAKGGALDPELQEALDQAGVMFTITEAGKAGKGRMLAFLPSRTPEDVVVVSFADGAVQKMSRDELDELLSGE